jgi:hypothetical protein
MVRGAAASPAAKPAPSLHLYSLSVDPLPAGMTDACSEPCGARGRRASLTLEVNVETFLRPLLAGFLLLGAFAVRGEVPLVGTGESFRVDGYLSVEFERQLDKKGRGDPNGSFDADLFDLVLNWSATDHVRLAADLTWEHGSATEDGRGNVGMEYAWVEYAFADALRVRGGKMFTPFGIYNEIHTAKPAYLSVKEPLSTNKPDKFGTEHRLYPRWTMGVALLGNGASSIGQWDYVVAVGNGENEAGTANPFEEDDNRQKAFMGRVRLEPVSRLQLGASFYTDQITEYTDDGEDTGGRTTLLTLGGQLTWTLADPAVGLELEYVNGTRRPSSGSGLPELRTHGATAMAWWTLRDRFTPYLRAEYLDPDTRQKRDEAWLVLGGLNVRAGGGLILKAEYDLVRAGAENARFSDGRNHYGEIKAAAVLGF